MEIVDRDEVFLIHDDLGHSLVHQPVELLVLLALTLLASEIPDLGLLEILREGALIKGYVKNITDYGVFVDLGGVDGLLHITDMTWGRIVHPSEMFEIGDEAWLHGDFISSVQKRGAAIINARKASSALCEPHRKDAKPAGKPPIQISIQLNSNELELS